jgi:serine/threonine protein kinase
MFLTALEIAPTERPEWLERECSDPDVRKRLERMLAAHEAPHSLHDAPARSPDLTLDVSICEGPGSVIGPYKLMEQIGEGGMGLVFVAEQQEPVRRKVALKIIKPGMDSRNVIARFEAERQALALMDHPNIAKILDAGTTEAHGQPSAGMGRPYFVMELVKGIPTMRTTPPNVYVGFNRTSSGDVGVSAYGDLNSVTDVINVRRL